jgi:NAD(P)H-flavin reductase
MLHHRQQYQELTLIVGAREPALLLYPGEYEHWRTQGLNIMLTVDHADESWRGGVGVVTTVLERLSLHSPADTMLMTCGPEVMMWYTIQTALGRGIPAGSLFLSMERNMNCAIALCGHCQFGPYFLCREGPVFHFEQLRSILRIDDL